MALFGVAQAPDPVHYVMAAVLPTGPAPGQVVGSYKKCSLIEEIISICLFFCQSWFEACIASVAVQHVAISQLGKEKRHH
jgi:hypothetical protein